MLSKKIVIDYWKARSTLQRERTVGFADQPMEEQDKEYQIRFDFIIPKIPKDKFTLDYGCGIGRYSPFFESEKYLGVDITENLLEIAQRRNPLHKFQQLSSPLLKTIDFKPEVIMTTTVLQHNRDDLVEKIIGSWKKAGDNLTTIILYENSHCKPDLDHICYRQVAEYRRFVSNQFTVSKETSWSHVIHGEQHSLIIFSVLRKPAFYQKLKQFIQIS